jgi:hypothetical protein
MILQLEKHRVYMKYAAHFNLLEFKSLTNLS